MPSDTASEHLKFPMPQENANKAASDHYFHYGTRPDHSKFASSTTVDIKNYLATWMGLEIYIVWSVFIALLTIQE